jgi:hypothetical protein
VHATKLIFVNFMQYGGLCCATTHGHPYSTSVAVTVIGKWSENPF